MKNKLLIILIVIILLFPNYTKADHGAPSTILYKAIVTKKDGLKCEDGYTVPYGSIIEVEEMYIIGEIPTLKFYYKDEECDYNVTYNDFELYNQNFNIKDYNTEQTPFSKFETALDVMVIADKGIKLYTGPAKIYDTITTIPNKTKLYAKYYIDNEEGIPWLYVTYKDKSGWIFNVEYDTVYGYTDEKVIITFNDDKNEVKCNTIIDGYYLSGMRGERKYYIKYNGKMYFVNGIGFQTNETIKLKKDLELNETLKEESKVIDTIKKGTTLKAEYSSGDNYSDYYYVTYNGKKGWIVIRDENYDEEEINNISKEDIEIENVSFKTNQIKADEKLYIDLKIDNNSFYEVDKVLFGFKNNKDQNRLLYLNDIESSPYLNIEHSLFENGEFELYFIRLELNDEDNTRLVYYTNEIKNNSDYSLKVINNIKNDEKETEEKDEQKDQAIKEIHKINNKHLIIGILSAISITITSIILIILINKRRKEKN